MTSEASARVPRILAEAQAEPGAEGLLFLAAFSWLAAAIHAVVAVAHFDEYLLAGVAFAGLATAQTAWGVLVYRRPAQVRLAAGMLLNAAVIAAWALSRTAGLPLGPEAGTAVPVGLADLGATVCELALVAGSALVLRRPAEVAVLPVWVRQTALVVLIFGGVALMTANHIHA